MLRLSRALHRSAARSASTLVLGEHAGGAVTPATLSAVTAAGKLGPGPVTVLLAGSGAQAASASAAKVAGVANVLFSEDARVSNGLAEGLSDLLVALQKQHSA
jgi:electron transfer flavoprotein alpha subunit